MGAGEVVIRDLAVAVDAPGLGAGIAYKGLVALVVVTVSHLGISTYISIGGFWLRAAKTGV